jgi:hypothetical protein
LDLPIAGTDRAESWLFWPMGIRRAGTMRQWGRHATAFVGRRHFDDADLIERRFELDLGPARLVQYANLEAGKVVHVRTGGYGRARDVPRRENAVPRAASDPGVIRSGDTTYDLVSLCGEPVFRDTREEQIAVSESDGRVAVGTSAVVVKETWTYDFGPRAFVRYVSVRDGRVTGVRTGSYGYSE